MIYASACSGIEAASVAWEPLGWRPAWFSEIKKFPCEVLRYRFPNVPNVGNLEEAYEKDEVRGQPIDLLVAGTPCQSFSCAGKRLGLDDPRGQLTLVYLALAARLRTRWLVWENVPELLHGDWRTFGTMLGILGKLGYGWAYRILDAQYFGIPQRRRRIFLVGYLGDWRYPAAVLFERQSLSWDSPPSRAPRANIAGTIGCRIGSPSADSAFDGGLHLTDIAHCLTARAGGGRREAEGNYVTHTLRGGGFDASEDGTGRGTPLTIHGSQDPDVSEIAAAIGRNGGREACVFDPWQVTSKENRSNPTPGLCRTLPAAPAAPSVYGHGHGKVRRLMPVECERLMGFPDDWTLVPVGKRGRLAKDGPRYEAIGNSMPVPVMAWIGSRIQMVEELTQPSKKAEAR